MAARLARLQAEHLGVRFELVWPVAWIQLVQILLRHFVKRFWLESQLAVLRVDFVSGLNLWLAANVFRQCLFAQSDFFSCVLWAF